MLKGHNNESLLVACGEKWKNHFRFSKLSSDWKEYSWKFKPNDDQFAPDGSLAVRFIVDDMAEELCLADIRMTSPNVLSSARNNELYIASETKSFSPSSVVLPRGVSTLKFPEQPRQCFNINGMPSPSDLSCEASLNYDDEGLIFHIQVRDDKIITSEGDSLWEGDSIQLRLNQKCRLGDASSSDIELGIGLMNGKPQNWCWTLHRALTSDEMDYDVLKTQDGYLANIRLKWKLLKDFDKNQGALSFNLLVNDNDGNGRKAIFLASGIHDIKSSRFNCVCLLEGKAKAFVNGNDDSGEFAISGKRIFVAPGVPKDGMVIVGSDNTGKKVSLPINANGVPSSMGAVATLAGDFSTLAAGPLTLELFAGGDSAWKGTAFKKDPIREANESLEEVKQRYERICRDFDVLKVKRWRITAIKTIMDRQLTLLREDLSIKGTLEESLYYAKRGARIIAEMKMLCMELERETAKAKAAEPELPVFQFVSTERTLSGGYFEGVMRDSSGKDSVRPVIFTGYGHFGQVERDLPIMPKLQANVIQVETGPDKILKGQRNDGSFIIDQAALRRIDEALESAMKNNCRIIFLLSPHYFPDWALKAHPEIADKTSGFVKYKFDHPLARQVIESYLKNLIPSLRDSKYSAGIHSLCLTNEPYFNPDLTNPFYKEHFKNWLATKYVSIAELNKTCGSSFISFDEAVSTRREITRADSLFYEFVLWRQETLASWHQWMAAIVKDLWPQIRVHSKIMMMDTFASRFTRNAVDPELFSKFCDLNGNDNTFWADHFSSTSWLPSTMTYALQASFRPVHIVNSENHIITDRFEDAIPYSEIYTAVFQQFMHGGAGSAVWVWENQNYRQFTLKHDFVGNIYRRPEAILAVTDASADANRVAPEIREFFNARPQVALLYSNVSNIMNESYSKRVADLFAAISNNGRKIGFLSEKQLQSKEWNGIKILFLPNVSYVEAETISALDEFTQRGGKIVSFGECLVKDPHGKVLPHSLNPLRIDGSVRGIALVRETGKIVDEALEPMPVKLDFNGQREQQYVEWAAVKSSEGSWLMNAVNYGSVPLKISLVAPDGMKVMDIIHLRKMEKSIILEPKVPLVFKVVNKL